MRMSFLYVNHKLPKKAMSFDIEIDKKKIAKVAIVAIAFNALCPSFALAEGNITDNVTKASQPIKDLLIGIADPVCYLVFTWGLLECMLGKASSGVTRMKYAALAYAGMNWLPTLMEILRNTRP